MYKYVAIGCFTLLVSSCSPKIIAPRQYMIDRSLVSYDPYGCWLNIELKSQSNANYPYLNTSKAVNHSHGYLTIGGELIVATTDTAYLLDLSANLHAIALTDINRAFLLLHGYHSSRKKAIWSSTLALATPVLNGPFSLITYPSWISYSLIQSLNGGESENYRRTGMHSWQEMRKFARYPFGFPPNFNRLMLQPKPFGVRFNQRRNR